MARKREGRQAPMQGPSAEQRQMATRSRRRCYAAEINLRRRRPLLTPARRTSMLLIRSARRRSAVIFVVESRWTAGVAAAAAGGLQVVRSFRPLHACIIPQQPHLPDTHTRDSFYRVKPSTNRASCCERDRRRVSAIRSDPSLSTHATPRSRIVQQILDS